MTDFVCGEVHSVPTGAAGRHTKEGWQQLGNYYCACVVRITARIHVNHVALQLFALCGLLSIVHFSSKRKCSLNLITLGC